LNRLNGKIAANVSASSCFIRSPLKNANGNQISEQMLRQKLSLTLNRLINASSLSYHPEFSSGRRRILSTGAGVSTGVPEITVGVPGADEAAGTVRLGSSGMLKSNSSTMICDIYPLESFSLESYVKIEEAVHPATPRLSS
jgi:hypothetical protein